MRVEIPYDWVLSKLELVHILKHFWKLTRLLFHSILIEKYRPGCVVTYRSGHLTMGEIIWYSNGWKSHQNHRKKKNTPFAVCGNPPGYHLLMTVGLEPTKMRTPSLVLESYLWPELKLLWSNYSGPQLLAKSDIV